MSPRPTNSMLRTIQITLVALVALSGAVANVRGTARCWGVSSIYWEHGWPIPWLGRQWMSVVVRGSCPLGLYEPSWAWNMYPGQKYGFSTFYLMADLAVLGILCVGTYFAFPRAKSDHGRFRFGLGTLLAVQASVSLVATLINNYPVALEYFTDLGLFLGIAFTVFSFGRTVYKIPSRLHRRTTTALATGGNR
jgi:hypothetical protein